MGPRRGDGSSTLKCSWSATDSAPRPLIRSWRRRASASAFFHHFESKKALARALVERYVDVDLALLGQGLDSVANVEETHRSGVLPTER